jgi:hypothetical protein
MSGISFSPIIFSAPIHTQRIAETLQAFALTCFPASGMVSPGQLHMREEHLRYLKKKSGHCAPSVNSAGGYEAQFLSVGAIRRRG